MAAGDLAPNLMPSLPTTALSPVPADTLDALQGTEDPFSFAALELEWELSQKSQGSNISQVWGLDDLGFDFDF